MRQLSDTLVTAQKQASRTPYINITAHNVICGVVRLEWERLYNGSEDDGGHGVTMPGDGSLVRVRITPPADAQKLYRQRVANPSPQSDFSQWTYTSQYNVVVTACCSLGAEVCIFWITNNRAVYLMKSTDYGVNWGSPEILDYTPTAAINGVAAAYKNNGDLALFFADQSTLFAKKRLNGVWQAKTAWGRSTGDLSSVAAVYDGDWNLVVAGQDTDGNFKLWSLVYGDGGAVPSGNWSDLIMVASAPADGDYEYQAVFLGKPDVCRCFFVERFTGIEAYQRPFWTYSIPGTQFTESLWREPVPFNLSSEYGLALAHHGSYCWLSCPGGVWRSALGEQSLELTADVISAKEELLPAAGRLTVELRNEQGQYAAPGQGALSMLATGSEITFSPGYVTALGSEVSAGPAFLLESCEYISTGGKSRLLLHSEDGWNLVRSWRARYQFRWNKDTSEACVRDILSFVLARCGLKLEVVSQSAAATSFYPDFAISPGLSGEAVVERLLSYIPDVLFMEAGTAYLVNPLPDDGPVYSYGGEHAILEGRYREGAWVINRVQIEGYEPQSGEALVADSFAWSEIGRLNDRLKQVADKNISTAALAHQRGEAWLRKAEVMSASGNIRVPVNCGQQLYDVIEISDSRAGLVAERRRMVGINLVFNPGNGEYEQKLLLGAV